MIEVWFNHRIVGVHQDASDFVIVLVEDRAHLVVLDTQGQGVDWHAHGSWHAASPASYDPETGERLTGIHCGRGRADDPTCKVCHPPIEEEEPSAGC